MKTNPWLSALIVVLLSGLLLAATATSTSGGTSTGPLLQITSYSTVPSVVYAGTTGYLQISISNNGAATASSAQALSSLDGVQNSVSIGDMAPGSSSVVVIPFHIDPASAGGIQVVGVTVNYYDNSGTTASSSGTISKTATLFVPLQVSQSSPLVVNTVSAGAPIAAGEPVQLQLSLQNHGGVVNNLAITAPDNSSFSLSGTSQVVVGTIPANSSRNITLTLLSSSSTPAGTYTVPLTFTYYDRLNTPASDNLSVGPVNVQAASTQYRLTTDSSPVEVGSQATVRLRLSNTGTMPISAVVDVNSTADLTPIGTARIYFDSVAPGQSQTQNLVLGVSAAATPGYYALPLKFTPSTGNAESQSVGIAITATPAVTVSIDQAGTPQAALLIANTGNSGIRSVYATVSEAGFGARSSIQDFIGTLNVDDYGTIPLSGMSGTVTLNLTFKDSLNIAHEIDEQIDVGTGAASVVSGSGGFGSRGGGAGNNFSGRGGGALGGLFGGRGANGSSGGPDLVAIGIGLAVLIVAAYLIRRWWLGRQKKHASSMPPFIPGKGAKGSK